MAISVISYGELIFGARKSKFVEQNLGVAKNIGEIFPLLDVTSKVMDIFGEIKVYTQKTGKPIDDFDLLIATTSTAAFSRTCRETQMSWAFANYSIAYIYRFFCLNYKFIDFLELNYKIKSGFDKNDLLFCRF